ncbi:MAG: Nucleoside triphosphate pyrophosphohydrolase [Acidimicrobiaceae bacterium]|nr:Nucleoside triphosphate pyrophosphohydrolase [Acidimicrobiaceae bacterium]
MVVAVGLGPAGPELTTPAASAILAAAPLVLLRTARHPAAAPLLAAGARPLDHHYEAGQAFEETYAGIVEEVVGASQRHGRVAYAVPGSPLVLESTVSALRSDPRVDVELVAGLSFLDLAWARLGVDPVEAGVRLVDAQRFSVDAAGQTGPLLVAHLWSKQLCSEVKLSVERFPSEPVIVLHHLGLSDEAVFPLAWADLDRELEADHLTCCYVPRLEEPVASELVRLDELVRVLRERCPWDAEQTHRSLARHLIEEAYEAVEAIDRLGPEPEEAGPEEVAHLEEELGDVLSQVFYHSVIAAEEGLFSLADVARTTHDKLVRRHADLFAETPPGSTERQVARWEEIKQTEKGRRSFTEDLPASLPALAFAAKLEGRLASSGLSVDALGERDPAIVQLVANASSEEALGELLLAIARLAGAARIEPEQALRRALGRFSEKVRRVEAEVEADRGVPLIGLPAEERLAAWQAVRSGPGRDW